LTGCTRARYVTRDAALDAVPRTVAGIRARTIAIKMPQIADLCAQTTFQPHCVCVQRASCTLLH
jgi:hypothetical protein